MNMDVSAKADRATNEQNQQAVSAVPVGIANAFQRLKRLFGIKPPCPHAWEDAYDFVACFTLVVSGLEAVAKDHVMQTMQWCPLCGDTQRKPNSARRATKSDLAQAIEAGTAKTEGLGPKDESAVHAPGD